MVKYKLFLKNLMEKEKELFTRFKLVHDDYANGKSDKSIFNELGSDVMKKLKQTEDKLCMQTEKGQYNKYSNQLSDKFWLEVRRIFPRIDEVEVVPVTSGVDVDELF